MLLVIAVAVVLALGGAAGAYFYFGRAAGPAHPAEPVAEKAIFVPMEPITVNVQSEGRARFLHVGLILKVNSEPAKTKLVDLMPELRSRVLLLLSNRAADTLVTAEDRTRLAGEVLKELNREPAANEAFVKVAGVSFNSFVVQ